MIGILFLLFFAGTCGLLETIVQVEEAEEVHDRNEAAGLIEARSRRRSFSRKVSFQRVQVDRLSKGRQWHIDVSFI